MLEENNQVCATEFLQEACPDALSDEQKQRALRASGLQKKRGAGSLKVK